MDLSVLAIENILNSQDRDSDQVVMVRIAIIRVEINTEQDSTLSKSFMKNVKSLTRSYVPSVMLCYAQALFNRNT